MFNRFSSSSGQPAGSTGFFGTPAPTVQPAQQGQPAVSPFSPFGGQMANAQVLGTPSGTPAPAYSFTNELENGVTIKLLSISAMPAYRHLSQEEIRVDDYMKGRKGPSAFPGTNPNAFSQPFSSSNSSNLKSNTGFGSTVSTGYGSAGSTGFGSFGSSATAPSAPSQVTSGFGGFGASVTAAPSTFGASSTFRPSTGFGASGSNLFGGSSGGFGTSAPSTGFGGFVSSSTTPAPAPPSTSTPFTSGLFGQPSQSQPQSQTQGFGGFGSTQPTSTSNGLFGAKPSTGSGLFGSTPSFGQQQQQPAQTTAGFGGFGQQQQPPQQQQQQPAQSSGFSGLFGSQQPTSSQVSSSSPFGFGTPAAAAPTSSTNNASSPFGSFNPPTTSTQSQFGGLNSFRPTTTTTNTGPSQFGLSSNLFPPSTTPLAPSSSSTSMFAPSSGIGLGTGTGSSFFNKPSTTTTTATSTNTTNSAYQPSGSNFLFPSTTPSASASNAPYTTSYNTTNFPNVAPPTTTSSGSLSLAPPLPSMYTNSTTVRSQVPIQIIPKSPVKFTPRTSFRIKPRESYNLTAPIPLNFGTGTNTTTATDSCNTVLVPRKLINSSANMKKLVIPEFNEEEKEDVLIKSIEPVPKLLLPQSQNILTDSLSYGQQYTFPPIKILKSFADRREIKNFVIGQKGIGEIRFLVPVDLSEIDPESLFGHFIEFCEGEAVLYPDPHIPKPEPGRGLNLPAQVRLERIWAHSKGSRDPILDPKNEKVIHFAQKLKDADGTNFVSYDPITGTWTFTVDHF